MTNSFKYNQKGIRETGFDNYIDHDLFKHPSHPEYQELCQTVDMQNEFESWFYSNEIRGDVRIAIEKLKSNICQMVDMNFLFNAYLYKEKNDQ